MATYVNPTVASIALVTLFGVTGIASVVGSLCFSEKYFFWHYTPEDHRKIGSIEIVAATLMAFNATWLIGYVLAIAITFGAVIFLLCRSMYIGAAVGMVLQMALAAHLF
jgi:hypothetical protein